MKIKLKINHKGLIKEYAMNLGEIVSIGRSSKCEFQLEDEKTSGRHCRFFLKKDRLEITDLDSKNGTYLNGIRIESSEVFIGDEIKLGETVVTIEEKNADAEAVSTLTFPGPAKDRISYELKADFTGARVQNQMANKKLSVTPKVNYDESRIREIELRKKANSRVRVSKEEVRSRNKFRSFLSMLFDLALLGAFMCLPIYVMNQINQHVLPAQRSLVLIVMEVFVIAIFLGVNFKGSKFTFGERLAGIKKLYTNQ
jgi:hypothetical protein